MSLLEKYRKGKHSSMRHFLQIISGFLIGQGSMFAMQTWYVAKGNFSFVSDVGIGLGFLSLIQWVADFGGVYLIPGFYKHQDHRNHIISFFYARIFFCISFGLILHVILTKIDFQGVTKDILSTFYIVIAIWSVNLTGIIDYKKLNRLAGPASGMSWLFASFGCLAYKNFENIAPGILIGSFYCLGLLITVIIQFGQIRFNFSTLDLVRSQSYRDIFLKFKISFIYSFSFFSSQLYGRILPKIIEKFIDSNTSGMFLYAKSVTNMIAQFVAFSRRVEFRGLVASLNEKQNIKTILKKQKLSFSICLFFLVLFIIVYLFVDYLPLGNFKDIINMTLFLVGLAFIWNISSSIGQYLIAVGKVNVFAFVQTFSAMLSLLFIFKAIEIYGIYSVYISEFIMYIFQLIIYSRCVYLFNLALLRSDVLLSKR